MVISGANAFNHEVDWRVQILDLSGKGQTCREIPDNPLGEKGISGAFIADKYILTCGGGLTIPFSGSGGSEKCLALVASDIYIYRYV